MKPGLTGRLVGLPLSSAPMTDRGLPIVDGAPACPFVAFEDDRDGRGQAPDHRHRCFAEPRPAPRALAHQEAYCLSSAFPVCPTFQDWARREAATARAAQLESDLPAYEEPVSQSLPPRELEPRHAPDTDTPPPLPPRRNPPRAWADPPPWADEADGDQAEPPSFLAERPPEPSDQRAAEAAAWGAASRGLAGSAADRLAGGYVDEADEPVAPLPAAYEAASYAAPVVNDPNERYRPPASAPVAEGAAASRQPVPDASPKPAAAPSGRSGRSSSPATPASPSPDGRRPGTPKTPQDPAELFGPAWEAPRRYEAYPSLRTRVGLPSFGGISRLGVAAVAVVLAAVALFFVGPMLLGIGGSNPGGGGGAPATQPAEELSPTPIPTEKPAPTPQVYVVARGDTMLKIAKKFGVTMDALLAANPKIKNPNKIGVGDSINIPVPEDDAGGSSGSVAAGPPAT